MLEASFAIAGGGAVSLIFFLCYLGVLGLESIQVGRRGERSERIIFGLLLAGIVLHTGYIWSRATQAAVSPLSSPHDWYMLAAWLSSIVAAVLVVNRPGTAIGLFLMPVVLGLIGIAYIADRDPFAPVRASRLWGNLHGGFLLLGTVAILIGFAAGMMYVVQSYRLKRKRSPLRGPLLPSLEWLEKVNSRALAISALLICAGFLSGIVLNRIKASHDQGSLPWHDPIVVSSAAMLAWVLAAELFRLTSRTARRGRKVAYLTLATFLFLAVCLTVLLFMDTRHGAASPLQRGAPDAVEPSHPTAGAQGQM